MRFLREQIGEVFAADLEYHPRRGVLYLCLGAASLAFWVFAPLAEKFDVTPLIFGLGSLTLLCKAIFLFRKSSEGLGLTLQELDALENQTNRKALPTIPVQAAQIFQDFGSGPLLLWPLLLGGHDFNKAWPEPPLLRVFITGAVIFCVGLFARRLAIDR